MKVSSLKSKLSNSNATDVLVFDYNGYNKAICFSINGKRFEAGFSEGKENIENFCTKTGYDDRCQESERMFFDNFNQVLRYANR